MNTDVADLYDHGHKNDQIILIILFNYFNL